MYLRVILAIAIAALIAPPAVAQVPPFFTSWGDFGEAASQFHTPVGVVPDASGTVFVIDSNLQVVKRFTATGRYLSQWPVSRPNGIALGPDGLLYITQAPGSVSRFTKDGSLAGQWMASGTGIAVDSDGSVYLAVGGEAADVVQKFTSSGTLVKQWGGRGVANGMFWGLEGVAVDGAGHIYTAEATGSRVQKFTTDGTFLLKWAIPGPVGSGFFTAVRLAVSLDGSLVYVVNNYNNRVEVYTSTGVFVGQWGSPGSGPGQFLNPIGISLDARGDVFVADTNNSRVQVFGTAATQNRQLSWGRVKRLFR